MNKNPNEGKDNTLIPIKKAINKLIDKVLIDKSFRKKLELNPKDTLLTLGIDVTDSSTISYLENNLSSKDKALLADGEGSKIFAVSTSAGIVVAVSTPAFPKGDEQTEE